MHILLATLNKQGKADELKYMDRWIDDHHFHWQSQNATDPPASAVMKSSDTPHYALASISLCATRKWPPAKPHPSPATARSFTSRTKGSKPMSMVFQLSTALV